MPQIKITLTIDIPEGAKVATPDVDYVEPEYVAPLPITALADESYDADVRVAHVNTQAAPGCPQHGAMTRFSAGTNKAGKPYGASWRCAVRDCPTKPIWDPKAA